MWILPFTVPRNRRRREGTRVFHRHVIDERIRAMRRSGMGSHRRLEGSIFFRTFQRADKRTRVSIRTIRGLRVGISPVHVPIRGSRASDWERKIHVATRHPTCCSWFEPEKRMQECTECLVRCLRNDSFRCNPTEEGWMKTIRLPRSFLRGRCIASRTRSTLRARRRKDPPASFYNLHLDEKKAEVVP